MLRAAPQLPPWQLSLVGLQVAQVPLSTSQEPGAGADTPPLSICRERNSSPSSTIGTRPDLSRQKIWPQMRPTCSGSKQPRQQLAATVEQGGAWLWSAQPSAAQRGWTGVTPVSGGTGADSTVPPALGQPQQLWSFGTQGKARPRAARSNSPAQRAATGGEQGIGLLSMKWGRTV